MPSQTIAPFTGQRPRISPRLLSVDMAQSATNCYLKRGRLEPAKGPAATGISVQANTKTLFWYNRRGNNGNGFWFEFDEVTDVFNGPIANDPHGRVYFIRDGVIRFTTAATATTAGVYPTASFELGIAVPGSFSVEGPTGEPPEGAEAIATSYVITYVSEYGEEGPPSPPTMLIDRWDGAQVTLAGLPVPAGAPLVSKRIYRVETSGVFQFVAEIPLSQGSYTDEVDTEALGETLMSEGWVKPVTDLEGLLLLPNGIFMAWKKSTLMFSVPYQPHAWPEEYQITIDYEIVAAAVAGDGVLVTTIGKPYYVSGTSPESIVQYKIDAIQSCVARRSVVDMGEQVFYASPDGLVMAGGANPGVITLNDITPEQWQQMNPETIHAYRWADRYLAFYDSDKCFTYHPEEGFLFYDLYADTAYLDELTGDVYLKQGAALTRWFAGNELSYRWRSKVFGVAPSRVMTCAKVDAESYPLTMQVFEDGALVKTKVVTDPKPFYIPCRSRYRELEVELTGTSIVNSIQIASSFSEIQ